MKIDDGNNTWNELQIKLKQKFPELTDNDLYLEVGKEQDMLRMVEYKLGKTKQELNDIIKTF